MNKVVCPKYMRGNGFSWNLNLFSGPKFTIICGNCECTFEQRIPLINRPTVSYPHCKALNRLPLVIG